MMKTMTPAVLKKALIALFTIVFATGFVVNDYQTYFAVALCVILAMIVYVGGK